MKSNAINTNGQTFCSWGIQIFIIFINVEFFNCVSARSILWRTEWVTEHSAARNEVYNCSVPHGFLIPREARSTLHPPCLRSETRSIIVLFHMGCRLPRDMRSTPPAPVLTARNEIYNCSVLRGLSTFTRSEIHFYFQIVLGPKYFWILYFEFYLNSIFFSIWKS